MVLKKCPKCKMEYKRPSAMSRLDNKTEICELCSLAESMAIFERMSKDKPVELSIVKETKLEKQIKRDLKKQIEEKGHAYYQLEDGTKVEAEPIENLDKY